MSDDMIKNVRDAMFREAQRLGMSLTGPLIEGDPMMRLAYTAIETMREPTEAMRQAGTREHALTSDPADYDQVSSPYRAMISAALTPSD